MNKNETIRWAIMTLLPSRLFIVFTLAVLIFSVAFCDTSFTVQVGTAYTAKPPLLWNKLGSFNEVEHSEIGQNLEAYGDLVFNPCKFGSGITPREGGAQAYASIQDSGIFKPEAGAVELWMYLYDYPLGWEYGVYGFVNVIHDDANSNPLILSYYNDYYGTGNIGMYLKFGAAQAVPLYLFNLEYLPPLLTPVHLAFVWNRKGIDGTPDTMRIYVDGVLKKTSTESNWGTNVYTGETTVASKVAPAWDLNYTNDRYAMDNIKVWDYAKIDYSDRETEGITTSGTYASTKTFTVQEGAPVLLGSLQSFLGISPSMFSGIDGGINTTISWSNPTVNNTVFMLSNTATGIISAWAGALSMSRDEMTNYTVYAVIEPIQITGVENGKQYIPGRVVNISFANGYNSQSITLDGGVYTSGTPINSVGTHIIVATCMSPLGVLNTKAVSFEIIPAQLPYAPYGVSTRMSLSDVRLTWSADQKSLDVAYPIAGYRIYRGENNGSPYQIGTCGTEKTFVDNGAEQSKSYNYYISTVDSMGNESELSAVINVNTVSDLVHTYDPVIKTRDSTVNARFVDNVGNTVSLDNTTIDLQCIAGNGLVDGSAGTISKNLTGTGSFSFVFTAGPNVGDNVVRVKSGGYEKSFIVYAGEVTIVASPEDTMMWVNETSSGSMNIAVSAEYGGRSWGDIPLSYSSSSGTVAGPSVTDPVTGTAMVIFAPTSSDYINASVDITSPFASQPSKTELPVITIPNSVPDLIGQPDSSCYQCPSEEYPQGYSENPVNTYTGNLIFSVTDIAISSLGFPISLQRSYNSLNPKMSLLGFGWTFNYSERLIVTNGKIWFVRADGAKILFTDDGSHTNFIGMFGNTDRLFMDIEGNYRLVLKQNAIYIFDEYGKRVKIVDRNGNVTLFEYGPMDRLASVHDENGRGISFTYNSMGCVASAQDPLGNVYTYTYDGNTNLIEVSSKDYLALYGYGANHTLLFRSDPKASMKMKYRNYEYDKFNRVVVERDAYNNSYRLAYGEKIIANNVTNIITIMTDESGRELRDVYDSHGYLVERINSTGQSEKFVYANGVVKTKHIDRNGGTNQYEYDAHYRLIKSMNAVSNVTQYAYDTACGCNALIAVTNANGYVTSYQYDDRQNLTRVIHPNGTIEAFTYAVNGLLLNATDQRGNRKHYDYDVSGNLIRVTYPKPGYLSTAPTLEYIYDALGRRTASKDLNGNWTRYQFNGLNLVTNVVYADGASILLLYDGMGRLTNIVDEAGNARGIKYDLSDKMIETLDELNNRTVYSYTAKGYIQSRTDPLLNVTQYEYDDAYRLKTVRNTLGGVRVVSHDSHGNVIAVTNERGYATRMRYDAAHRIVEVVNAITNAQSFKYDAMGRITSIKDADGRITGIGYDSMGHIVHKTDKLGHSYYYSYDACGNLASVMDRGSNVTRYAYDELNRLISVTNAMGHFQRFEYNANGKRTIHIDEAGYVTRYLYDSRGRIIDSVDPKGYHTYFSYDLRGLVTNIRDKRGNRTIFSYDARRQLKTITDADGKTQTFTYDENGNRIRISDKRGNETAYVYDGLNRLVAVVDALSSRRDISYDELGNITNVIERNGAASTYTYDPLNRVTAIRYPNNAQKSFSYNNAGLVTNVIDEAGYTTSIEYDPLGRMSRVIDALTNTITYTHDANGRLLSVTDKRGMETKYEYNALGKVVATIDALTNTTRLIYDERELPTNIIDAVGHETRVEYDANHRPIRITDVMGFVTRREYDPNGNMVAAINKTGNTTAYAYDIRNRLIAITNALGNVTKYEYDENDNRTAAVDPNGGRTTFVYDALNRLTTAMDALTNAVRYEYDSMGHTTNVIDKSGYSTRYEYDIMGRVTRMLDANGDGTTYQFDARGFRTAVIDKLGNIKRFDYDALGRMTNAMDALNISTGYRYDANNNLVGIINALSNSYRYEYDPLNRLTAEIDPLGNTSSFTYDAKGRLIGKGKPEGEHFEYAYDPLGRLTNETQYRSDGQRFQDIAYAYNPNNDIVQIKDAYIEMGFVYDALSRRVSEYAKIGSVTKSMSRGYDASGNHIATVDYEGRTNRYEYDAMNRLTALNAQSLSGETLTTRFAYDVSGRLIDKQLPNGMETTFAYDVLHRVTNVGFAATADATVYDSIAYSFDKMGNKTSRTSRDGSETYMYDTLYRLTNAAYADASFERFDYDVLGNRTKLVDNEGVTGYTYDPAGKLLTKIHSLNNGMSETTTYGYNRNGDMTNKIEIVSDSTQGLGLSVTNTTAYNRLPDGRIEEIKYPSVEKPDSQFKYSSMLQRLMKVDSTGTNIYLYDGENAIYVYDEHFSVKKHFVHEPRIDAPIAVEIRQTNGIIKRYYHLADEQGTVRYLVNDKREIVQTYRYKAFGKPLISGSDMNIYTYTGREYDPDSELYYYRSRYYDPVNGRFDRIDDKRSGGNWYAYVKSNPLKHRDPRGHEDDGGGGGDYGGWYGGDYVYTESSETYENYNDSVSTQNPGENGMGETTTTSDGGGTATETSTSTEGDNTTVTSDPNDGSSTSTTVDSEGNVSQSVLSADGTITTTVVNADGSGSETVQTPDGITVVTEIAADGTITETSSDTDGNSSSTITYPDGSQDTAFNNADGGGGFITSDNEGNTTSINASADGVLTTEEINVTDGYVRVEVDNPDGIVREIVSTDNGWVAFTTTDVSSGTSTEWINKDGRDIGGDVPIVNVSRELQAMLLRSLIQGSPYGQEIRDIPGFLPPIIDINAKITSGYFNIRGNNVIVWHGGIDIGGVSEGTSIFAAITGKVVSAGGGVNDPRGYFVWMQITEGAYAGLYVGYFHMCAYPLVRTGEDIQAGTQIGSVGSTGYSEGPHLHIEITGDTGSSPRNTYNIDKLMRQWYPCR